MNSNGSSPSAANAASGGTKQDRVTNLVTNAFIFAAGSILLALLFWVGSSITDLSKSVTLMSANVDNLQKSITELQQGQGATSKTTSDLQAGLAAGGARTGAIEADIVRVKERVRMLEGQKPLNVTP